MLTFVDPWDVYKAADVVDVHITVRSKHKHTTRQGCGCSQVVDSDEVTDCKEPVILPLRSDPPTTYARGEFPT